MLIGFVVFAIGLVAYFWFNRLAFEAAKINILQLNAEIIVKLFFYIVFIHLIDRRVGVWLIALPIILIKPSFDISTRKIELNLRLDFLWRTNFKKETDEVEVTSTMNRLLLENVLPKHVIEIIMNPSRNKDVRSHKPTSI